MSAITTERLGAWVGRTESRSDVVTAWPAIALAATLLWTANSAGNDAMAGTAYF